MGRFHECGDGDDSHCLVAMGYCRGRTAPATPLTTISGSFQVWFFGDHNGRPSTGADLYTVTLTPGEVREQFAFDTLWNDTDCAYYDYTAVLPMPFPVAAGTRYWVMIRRELDARGPWSWRLGIPDNGISAYGSLGRFVVTAPNDLAFSLSNE